jgi:hypothetical protein
MLVSNEDAARNINSLVERQKRIESARIKMGMEGTPRMPATGAVIFDYIELFYYRRRRHWAIGYPPPIRATPRLNGCLT